jgi:hypothetical protein
MRLLLITMILSMACFGQGQKANWGPTGAVDFSSLTTWKPAQLNFSSLPAASACTGCVFIVKDATSASSCSAGGSSGTPATCYSTGSTWIATGGGGGGGGSPGGSSGQIQYNNSGSFGGLTNPLTSGGGTTYAAGHYCNTGSISLSSGTFTYPGGTASAASATSQEFTIITGLDGRLEYDSTQLSEHTKFTQGASVTNLTGSMGLTGSSTNDLLLPQTQLMQSSGDAWFAYDRPQPPILGSSNTYSIVIALRTTGGNISDLTAGQINYKVCGWLNQ